MYVVIIFTKEGDLGPTILAHTWEEALNIREGLAAKNGERLSGDNIDNWNAIMQGKISGHYYAIGLLEEWPCQT